MKFLDKLHKSALRKLQSHFFLLAEGKGAECPCCGRFGKVYNRKLNSGMSRKLIEIYKFTLVTKPEDGWIHISHIYLEQKENAVAEEYSKLRFWGLLEPKGSEEKNKSRGSGYWRITEKGRDFVEGRVAVSKSVTVFGNRHLSSSEEQIILRESLGENFDFDELMAS